MKYLVITIIAIVSSLGLKAQVANEKIYLTDLKEELQKEWPENRTINIVFHGHSVPSGYYNTPNVRTLDAYPHMVLKSIKEKYPYAVVNVITTSIGGENSTQGVKRFKNDVLTHKPDVLFIDYALNDRNVTLDEACKAWGRMIKMAKKKGVKVVLCTPSPDKRVSLSEQYTILDEHSQQIRMLAKEYRLGLVDSYKTFKQEFSEGLKYADFMATVNHINERGHWLVTNEIMKYF